MVVLQAGTRAPDALRNVPQEARREDMSRRGGLERFVSCASGSTCRTMDRVHAGHPGSTPEICNKPLKSLI